MADVLSDVEIIKYCDVFMKYIRIHEKNKRNSPNIITEITDENLQIIKEIYKDNNKLSSILKSKKVYLILCLVLNKEIINKEYPEFELNLNDYIALMTFLNP
jgi:hypothetical protein